MKTIKKHLMNIPCPDNRLGCLVNHYVKVITVDDVLELIDEQIKEAHKYNNEDVDLIELKKRITGEDKSKEAGE